MQNAEFKMQNSECRIQNEDVRETQLPFFILNFESVLSKMFSDERSGWLVPSPIVRGEKVREARMRGSFNDAASEAPSSAFGTFSPASRGRRHYAARFPQYCFGQA